MTGTHPLADARARLQRGRRQLQALEHAIGAFLEREPYRTVIDIEREGVGRLLHRVHIVEAPDPEWSFVVGEIAGNLRSSLDYAVCAVTRENGQEVTRQTAYPLTRSPDAFESRKADLIGGVPSVFQDIIGRFQPHNTEDATAEGLGLLADLTNFDKHQALHVMGSIVRASTIGIRMIPSGETVQWTGQITHTGPFEDGAVVQEFDITEASTILGKGANVHFETQAQMTFDVAFAEGGPAAGRPVLETVNHLGTATVAALNEIEKFFSPILRTLWDEGGRVRQLSAPKPKE